MMKIYKQSSFLQWVFRKSILSKTLHKVYQYYDYFHFKIETRKQAKDASYRKEGYEDNRFSCLKALKGKYIGKRCFITCTGPSLTIEDLEKLKNEYVFGMNSICMIHDKTDWKPDFFGIQDPAVFNKLKETLLSTDNGFVFAPYEFRQFLNTPEDWIYFHISSAYHMYDRKYKEKFWSNFSDDCYVTVYDGFSITYSLIQIAIYLGFNEIYLIGADCSYTGSKQHFIEYGHLVKGQHIFTAGDRNIVSYLKAKEYADTHSIKIVNVTRGGKLEVFLRKTLEEVLAVSEKNKVNI